MVAVFLRFTDPQFADYAAFGKDILHTKSLLTFVVKKTLAVASSVAASRRAAIFVGTSNQIIMSGGAKVWQGEALSIMPAFRIRMARKLFTTV
jgi:hypothetical protein